MKSIYSSLLKRNVDWSDEEIAARKKYLKWEEVTIKWEEVNLTWDEVAILLEVINRGGGGYGYKEYIDGNPWKQSRKEIGEEKTRKLIKLYCRVNGIETKYEVMVNDEIKVSIQDFELFIKDTIEKKIFVKIDK